MRWLYGLDLGNSLDNIGIGSVYQRDILTPFRNEFSTVLWCCSRITLKKDQRYRSQKKKRKEKTHKKTVTLTIRVIDHVIYVYVL